MSNLMTLRKSDKQFEIGNADFTGRLLGRFDYKDRIGNGKYFFEMQADITDGNYKGQIYWIFEMPVDEDGNNLKELDEFDYSVDEAFRIEWDEVCISPKCKHDYIRILTNKDNSIGKFEGDYECTHCGDVKTEKELNLLNVPYFD